MRLSAVFAVGLVAVSAVAGCGEQSRIDPNARVTISGVAIGPDGVPLRDRPVRLGGGVPNDDAALAVVTLGLACTSGICQGQVHDTSTDRTGNFVFHLRGRDTQSTFGSVKSELVSAYAAPRGDEVSGASASARFVVQTTAVTLPALHLVDPDVQVESAAANARISWAVTAPPGPYDVRFEANVIPPVWVVNSMTNVVTVDGRVLEDTVGRVVVAGGSTDRIVGSSVTLAWRSGGVGYVAGAGAPPSRGLPCLYADDAGATQRVQDCSLTDGDLIDTASRPSVCRDVNGQQSCALATTVTIDMPAGIPSQLLVVRGCDGGCPVAVRSGGAVYRALGSVSNEFGSVPLPAGVTAVRVGLGRFGLQEVSLWGPVATPAFAHIGPGIVRPPVGTNPAESSSGRVWPIALAVVLLALLGAALFLQQRTQNR
jgi:hypothetical protein